MFKITLLICFISRLALAGPVVKINSNSDLNNFISNSPFNGAVLVAKDNQILLRRAYGFKNFDSKIPLSINDKFQIGSNTKQFVAAALLKLQDEGKISLEDRVTKYLPANPEFSGIKIRDLLNHTSGISNYTDHNEFWEIFDTVKTLSLDEIIEFIKKYPLDFKPTTNWKYSNSNFAIAGKIIEVVSHESWNEYIKNNFLLPLKMENTGYVDRFENVSDVSGYLLIDGAQTAFEMNLSWALSAGALYSNVDDLLKWTEVYTQSSLLSENAKKEMQTPFLKNYGLGIMITSENNETMLFHNGRTPGFNSSIAYLKNSKLSIITLDNVDGRYPVANLLREFYTNGNATVIKYDSFQMSENELQNFEGLYGEDGKIQLKVFLKNGKLFLQPNDGQPPYLLRANDKDSFDLMGISGEEFLRDEVGNVFALKHYQNGQEIVYWKK